MDSCLRSVWSCFGSVLFLNLLNCWFLKFELWAVDAVPSILDKQSLLLFLCLLGLILRCILCSVCKSKTTEWCILVCLETWWISGLPGRCKFRSPIREGSLKPLLNPFLTFELIKPHINLKTTLPITLSWHLEISTSGGIGISVIFLLDGCLQLSSSSSWLVL